MNSTSSTINDCKKHLKKRKKAYSDESILYYFYYNRVGIKSRCYIHNMECRVHMHNLYIFDLILVKAKRIANKNALYKSSIKPT